MATNWRNLTKSTVTIWDLSSQDWSHKAIPRISSRLSGRGLMNVCSTAGELLQDHRPRTNRHTEAPKKWSYHSTTWNSDNSQQTNNSIFRSVRVNSNSWSDYRVHRWYSTVSCRWKIKYNVPWSWVNPNIFLLGMLSCLSSTFWWLGTR